MDKKKIAAQLRAAAQKLEAASGNVDVSSLVKDLAAMTQENDHTNARLMLAEKLGNKKWTTILAAMETINSAYGYLPPGFSELQGEALESLLHQAKTKWGPEAADALYAAF